MWTGIVSPKCFGPFIHQAEVGAVAPEMLRDVPGKAAPSQGLLGAHKTLSAHHPHVLPSCSGACSHSWWSKKHPEVWIFRQWGRESFIHKPHTGQSIDFGIRQTSRPGFQDWLSLPGAASQILSLPLLTCKMRLLSFRILYSFSFRHIILGT